VKSNFEGSKRSRRSFLLAAGTLCVAAAQWAYAGGKKNIVLVKNKIPVHKTVTVTPPGSKSIDHFSHACIACHLCVSACPSQVIQGAANRYSGTGLFLPYLDNEKGYCTYECNRCGEVCPSGAILPLPLKEKQRVQIGKVHFIRENCIVITQGTVCAACSEHCPTKAVDIIPGSKPPVPVINQNICVGCGACEYACPAKPHKSIYVDGNPVHLKADKPKKTKLKAPKPDEDFPF